jgi:hypothetical protein
MSSGEIVNHGACSFFTWAWFYKKRKKKVISGKVYVKCFKKLRTIKKDLFKKSFKEQLRKKWCENVERMEENVFAKKVLKNKTREKIHIGSSIQIYQLSSVYQPVVREPLVT